MSSDSGDSGLPPSLAAIDFPLRDTFLNAALVEVFMGGLYTMLFMYTIALMFTRTKFLRSNKVLMGALVVLYVFIIIHMCLQWLLTRQVWISDGQTSTTTFFSLAGQALWLHETSSVFNTGSTLIADGIMIWRTWVIWNRSWKALIVPILSWLASFICSIFALISLAKPLTSDVTADPSTIYLGLSLSTTVICTLMIVYRIVRLGSFSHNSPYKSVIEIICESAALYSIALIIFLPMYSSTIVSINFPSEYMKRIVLGITGMAPTLIVARVASGVGRSNEAWSHAASTFRTGGSHGGSTAMNAMGSRTQVGSGLVVNRSVEKYPEDSVFTVSQV